MSLNLNLGCGRMIFPTTPDNPFASHVRYNLEPYCPEAFDPAAQWVNIDHVPGPGINEVLDLFAYPWIRSSNNSPFNTSSVDIIWCSHIAEHIPHEAKLKPGAAMFPQLMAAAAIDGWYAFFAEAHRVLKPNGVIMVMAPQAFSAAGVNDPTHHRLLTPGTFSYFQPNPKAPFDTNGYAAHFEFDGDPTQRLLNDAADMLNSIASARETLAKLEKDSDDFKKVTEYVEEVKRLLDNLVNHSVNISDEFFVRMKAIKEPI